MLNVLHAVDLAETERLIIADPFQLALPCWNRVTMLYVPTETVRISITERNQHMTLRAVAAQEAPERLKSTFATTNQDMTDVMNALSKPETDPTKKAVAFIVDMSDAGWNRTTDEKTMTVDRSNAKYPKPENAFAYALRRRFEAMGVPLVAYASGKMQVTVRKKNQMELAPKKKK